MRFSPTTIVPSEFQCYDGYDLGGAGEYELPFNVGPCSKFIQENPVDNFQDLDTCCVCGTHFRYGEAWEHTPTGQRLSIGHVCARKYGLMADMTEYNNRRATYIRKQQRIAERRRIRSEMKTFLMSNRDLARHLRADHHIVRDLRAKLIHWGNLTEKQVALATKIATEMEARAADEAAKNYVPVPESDKRLTIEGTVLGVKFVEGFGYDAYTITKMIVECDDGNGGVFKLYGTMPQVIEDAIMESDRDEDGMQGDDGLRGAIKRQRPRVRFVCRTERSNDDPHFGFFKRPTKGEVLS